MWGTTSPKPFVDLCYHLLSLYHGKWKHMGTIQFKQIPICYFLPICFQHINHFVTAVFKLGDLGLLRNVVKGCLKCSGLPC